MQQGKVGARSATRLNAGLTPMWAKWVRTLVGAQIVQPGCPGVLWCRTARGKFSRPRYLGATWQPGYLAAETSQDCMPVGECIGNGRIHGPSNTLSWPQETKIMIPDTLPDSCPDSVVVILLTETIQHGLTTRTCCCERCCCRPFTLRRQTQTGRHTHTRSLTHG